MICFCYSWKGMNAATKRVRVRRRRLIRGKRLRVTKISPGRRAL